MIGLFAGLSFLKRHKIPAQVYEFELISFCLNKPHGI